ncbi:hypothetical protein GCM10010102_10110 [Promicromonospora citrea]|uniref:Uncharacterized protein n=1 Tax=Promicromonospora citrea TaxID=43677 RepID=A0A8H9GF00_9MICO|nr:hypothetical protein GCM10010102_10110 [Promicromonospora citrea]
MPPLLGEVFVDSARRSLGRRWLVGMVSTGWCEGATVYALADIVAMAGAVVTDVAAARVGSPWAIEDDCTERWIHEIT